VQAARAVAESALVEAGPVGLTEMAVELSVKPVRLRLGPPRWWSA
jgi:hypothetical protein